jgi:hypothetical protein
MNGWWLALAMLLPGMTMALWLRLLWPEAVPGRWPLVLGYGYLFGMLGVAALLWFQGALGWPLGSGMALTVSGLLLAAAMFLLVQRPYAAGPDWRPARERLNLWQGLAFALILLWVVARWMGLALEVWWLPLFPWDAWTTWGARAKVWSELQTLVPFVSPAAWLADRTGALHTIGAWGYPATISLVATWPTLVLGTWNETAANLPWLGVALALGLGFYGQARLWGASPLTAMVFVWLVMSVPLLNTHIALAGYADVWMATVYGLALMAFLQWVRSGDRRQGLLAILLMLICVAIKREGLVWAALFIPALLAAKLGRFSLLMLGGILVTLGVLLWMLGGLAFEVPGLGVIRLSADLIQLPLIGEMRLENHAPWEPVLRHYFLYSNWHLFTYLVLLTLVAASLSLWRNPDQAWQRAGLVWALGSVGALYFLFFWTDAYLWAVQATSINRLLLHFMPALLFWSMTVWLEVAGYRQAFPKINS